MRKHLFFALTMAIVLGFMSCSKPKGHLVGIYSQSHKEAAPYGMVFVPKGSFNMGDNEQSVAWALQSPQKRVSVDAFWIDQTEITNGEYRQFVEWVRDSIVRRKLMAEMDQVDENEAMKYFKERNEYSLDGEITTDSLLNWKAKIPWNQQYDEEDDLRTGKWRAVRQMYYEGADMIERGQLNAQIMIYKYRFVNYDQAALPGNEFNPYTNSYNPNAMVKVDSSWMNADGSITDTVIVKPLRHRSDLISTKHINIYPDTMVWMRDFSYSYNEPMMHNYFSHPGFGEFPVVGVSWDQAQAFCWWRTSLYRNAGQPRANEWRLPTDAEWEYAARGGRHNVIYPWGGPYVRDHRGCFLANFKPMRGNYTEDGYLYPCKVGNYIPNDFGLYDMAGNVAEWTITTYDEAATTFTSDINPHYNYRAKKDDPAVMRRKVVRGGSWKDVAAFLQCATVTYEYQNKRSSSIGFRCVRSYIGY